MMATGRRRAFRGGSTLGGEGVVLGVFGEGLRRAGEGQRPGLHVAGQDVPGEAFRVGRALGVEQRRAFDELVVAELHVVHAGVQVLQQHRRFGQRGEHVEQVVFGDRPVREARVRIDVLQQWPVGVPRRIHRRHQLGGGPGDADEVASVEVGEGDQRCARRIHLLHRQARQAETRVVGAIHRAAGDGLFLGQDGVGDAARNQQAAQGQVHLRTLVRAVVDVAVLQRFEVGFEEQQQRLVGDEGSRQRRRRDLAGRRLEVGGQQLEGLALGVAVEEERVARPGLVLRRGRGAGGDRHSVGTHAVEHGVVLDDQVPHRGDGDAARQRQGAGGGIPVRTQAADGADAGEVGAGGAVLRFEVFDDVVQQLGSEHLTGLENRVEGLDVHAPRL
ncbi:hypothetical protein D3C76_579220 [compost metagenome]